MWVCLEFVVGDELHDVCGSVLTVTLRVKSLVIAIKSFHRFEVSLTDAHNDYSDGQFGSTNNFINSLVHVADDTVCDYY
jgi:hypothetical protein